MEAASPLPGSAQRRIRSRTFKEYWSVSCRISRHVRLSPLPRRLTRAASTPSAELPDISPMITLSGLAARGSNIFLPATQLLGGEEVKGTGGGDSGKVAGGQRNENQ